MLEPVALLSFPVVVIAASGLIIASCQRDEAPAPVELSSSESLAPTVVPEDVAAPAPALGRAELLAAVDVAASAYAAGRAPVGPDALVGGRFIIRQAFGCTGPSPAPAESAPADGLGHWRWGAGHRTIAIELAPGDWSESPLIAGAGWEAAEGFWIARPWLRTDDCPGVPGDPLASGPVAASPQAIGLAAVFDQGASRIGRRNGRAYAFTVRGEGDQPPPAPKDGYRLVLEGRMTAFPDGRAIRCRASSPDQRPVCIVATQLRRVAFLDASGQTLSEWRLD